MVYTSLEIIWLFIYGYTLIDIGLIIISIDLIGERPFMVLFLPVMPLALVIYFVVWLILPQPKNTSSTPQGNGYFSNRQNRT